MRFLIPLLIFLISSCQLRKVETGIGTLENISSKKIEDPYREPLHIIHDTIFLIEQPRLNSPIETPIQNTTRQSNIPNISNRVNIINLIDTLKILDSSFALIGYNVPELFKIGKSETIKLRITREKVVESIIIGERNIPIIGTNSSDKIILETIKIGSSLSARLFGDNNYFKIQNVSSHTQDISDTGYTEWIWILTPIKSGKSSLKMIITQSNKDIVVYEKEIPVKSDWFIGFKNWFSKWWSVIISVIIMPILAPIIIKYLKSKFKIDQP